MEEYKLFLGEVPDDGLFDRVHAILLMPDGRVLMRYKNGEPRVTGGRIDAGDRNIEAALRREVLEEINCRIDKCDYLGYIEANFIDDTPSSSPKREKWARMVARIVEIGEPKPDPDRENNWIYGRALATREIAMKELGVVPKFGQNNLEVLEEAYQVAEDKGYFTAEPCSEFEFLNPESYD